MTYATTERNRRVSLWVHGAAVPRCLPTRPRLESVMDMFCPACFRTVPTAVPAAPGGHPPALRWVYRDHERTSFYGDETRTERCAGSGRSEHEARQAW